MGVAKYGKPEEMEARINEYFAQFENPQPLLDQDGRVLCDKYGKPVFKESAPTQSGLALFLGFSNRCSLWEYGNKPTFARVIETARTRIGAFLEKQALFGKNPNAAMFLMQNLNDGWKDSKFLESDNRAQAPKIACVVFVDGRTKNAKAAAIPTIEAEVIHDNPSLIAKPKRKASKGKKLGRPSKKDIRKREKARAAKEKQAVAQ